MDQTDAQSVCLGQITHPVTSPLLIVCVLPVKMLPERLLHKDTLTYIFIWTGEREEVCAGKEFRLPVYSTSRTVTFTPDSGEPKRVLLENTSVSEISHALVLFLVD